MPWDKVERWRGAYEDKAEDGINYADRLDREIAGADEFGENGLAEGLAALKRYRRRWRDRKLKKMSMVAFACVAACVFATAGLVAENFLING